MYLVGWLLLSGALAACASEVAAAQACAQSDGHGNCSVSDKSEDNVLVQVRAVKPDPVPADPTKRDVLGCKCGPGSPISNDKQCCYENKFNYNGHNCIVSMSGGRGATCSSASGKSLCCKDHGNAWCCPEGTACIEQKATKWNPNSCTEIQKDLSPDGVRQSWVIVGGGPGSPGMPIKYHAGVSRVATETEVNDIETKLYLSMKFFGAGFSFTNINKWTNTIKDSITKKQQVDCEVLCPQDHYAWVYYTKINGVDTLHPDMKHLFASCSAVVCSPFGMEKPPLCPFGWQDNQKGGFDCCTSNQWVTTEKCEPKDDDTCLQNSEHWGSLYTCAGGEEMGDGEKTIAATEWCKSWAKDAQRCCPITCGTGELTEKECKNLPGEGKCKYPNNAQCEEPSIPPECPQGALLEVEAAGQVADKFSEVRPKISEKREPRLMQIDPSDKPPRRDVYGCMCGPGSPISDDKKCCHENKFSAEGHNCIVGGGRGVTCKSTDGKSNCCKDRGNAWCCPDGTACIPQHPSKPFNESSCTARQKLTKEGVTNGWQILGGGPGSPENMSVTFEASVETLASEEQVNSVSNAFEVSFGWGLENKFSFEFKQYWKSMVLNEITSDIRVTCDVVCPKDYYVWAFTTHINGIDTIPTSWTNLWASCSAVVCSPFGEVKPPACPFGYQGNQKDGFDCCTSYGWADKRASFDLPPLCN